MKKNLPVLATPLLLIIGMVLAVRYDAATMMPHTGGILSSGMILLALVIAVVQGVRFVKRRLWFRAALMALVLVCCAVCDGWLWTQVPPCSECEPAEYAEWIERTGKG